MFDTKDGASLAASLDGAADAHLATSVVFAAIELGLVEALARSPSTAPALAEKLSASLDGTTRLANALVALGLVSLRSGTYEASSALLELVRSPAFDALAFRAAFLAPLVSRLAEACRTGAPQHAGWSFAERPPAPHPYDELAKHPRHYERFMGAMDAGARGVGGAIAAALDLRSGHVVVDAGCGGGAVARELLRAVPGLRVCSFDLGPSIAIAREASRRDGLLDRHELVVADIRAAWPFVGADVALLSAVLADFSPSTRGTIVERARDATKADGVVAVSERLLTDDETGPPGAVLMSLVLLAGTAGGKQLTVRELDALFAGAGLARREVGPCGGRDLAVATRLRAP